MTSITLTLVTAFLFFVTSFIFNFLQLVNYLVFQFTNPKLRRQINRYLQDVVLSQMTIIMEWFGGVQFRLFYADAQTLDKFGHENSVILGNHRYQIDLIFYWLFSDLTNTLGRFKAFAKRELRRMPIVGWCFHFGEFIFLNRNWKEDEKNIGPAVDCLMAHPYPITLLIFPEGTRFTDEKYQAAQEFIKKRNLSVELKDHLLPRVKGTACMLDNLQSKHPNNFGVYNVQLVSQSLNNIPGASEPSIQNFVMSKPFKIDCYIKRIDQSQIPAAGAPEAEHTKFLYSVFEEKDKLMQHYRDHNEFPHAFVEFKRASWLKFARFLLLNVGMSGSLVGYLIYLAVVTHSFYLRLTIYTIIALVSFGMYRIFYRLRNSNYGAAAATAADTQNVTK